MSEADALKMITLNGAEVIGFGDRLGSLEKGKIADVVIWNGHPLTYRGTPDMVLIDGKVVFQKKATGGASRVTDQAQPH